MRLDGSSGRQQWQAAGAPAGAASQPELQAGRRESVSGSGYRL